MSTAYYRQARNEQPGDPLPYVRCWVRLLSNRDPRLGGEHLVETAAAETMGVSLSEFYRQAARARAEEILAERSSVVLAAASAARFLDALDDPTRFEPGLCWLQDRPSVVSS